MSSPADSAAATDDSKQKAINPANESENVRWYKNVKFYLGVAEIALILTTFAIHFRPWWFAPTAFDYLAAGNPTFILQQAIPSDSEQNKVGGHDEVDVGFCPIVDPHCAKWQNCLQSEDEKGQRFVCAKSGASIHFQEELLSNQGKNDITDASEDAKTTTIPYCLAKVNGSTDDKQDEHYRTSVTNLGHRLNDVRTEADEYWRHIQLRQTYAIRTIMKVMAIVIATMITACCMLFARYWVEKSVLSRCWSVSDFSTVDLKTDDVDNTAWDHKLTLFFGVLGTAIVPVILLAHHSTTNTKPLQLLAGLQPSSLSSAKTTFLLDLPSQLSDSLGGVTMCQTPPPDARHSRTCVRWSTCRTVVNLHDESGIVIDCYNGSVHDFDTLIKLPPLRRSTHSTQHFSMFGKSKTTANRCIRGDEFCSEDSESGSSARFEQQSSCIKMLVEELNNLKHLSGSRKTHVSMQNKILLYLYVGLSLFFAVFVAMILFSAKTMFLLSMCCWPVAMTNCQYLLYEICVRMNFSNNVLTQQSRAILAKKLQENGIVTKEIKSK